MSYQFQSIPCGQPIPPKVFAHATDVIADYVRAGRAWVDAGRPPEGPLYATFCQAEGPYHQMADALFMAKMTDDQRAEWARLHTD